MCVSGSKLHAGLAGKGGCPALERDHTVKATEGWVSVAELGVSWGDRQGVWGTVCNHKENSKRTGWQGGDLHLESTKV